MRAHFASRLRSSSLSAVPPPRSSRDYSPQHAIAAASILYRSPLPSPAGLPVYILNAAALPDSHDTDYDSLLPYVLARLPGEEELIGGREYEVVFFAGGDGGGEGGGRKGRPGWGWFVQAYHVLSRAMRKRLQRLYIVHERSWVRVLTEVFSTIVSPKFRRKIVHVSTLSSLALQLPIENLLIPPSAYVHDRRLSADIYAPYATGRRAFGAQQHFPKDYDGNSRLPRVLRETTSFLLHPNNVKTEGLFRIPAHSRLRGALREAYDRGQKFIVWKDNDVTLPLPAYRDAQNLDAIIRDVDVNDAYNAHMAAALCKMWYAELRQPLFPASCYRDLKTIFGDRDPREELPLELLVELIDPRSEWSSLPASSRDILTRHLLPLLHRIASHAERNKMTPDNLATCFAPALLCGPDQIEDAKMTSIIRRILGAATDAWEKDLRERCGVDVDALERDLRPPPRIEDYEDPLSGSRQVTADASTEFGSSTQQYTGIVMQDNDGRQETGVENSSHPVLPPRPLPTGASVTRGADSGNSTPRRRPTPPSVVPPRYSTIVTDNPVDISESPTSWAATTDGFAQYRGGPADADRGRSVDVKGGLSGTIGSRTPTAGSSIDSAHDIGSTQPGFPSLNVPKRKGLTSQQIDRADRASPSAAVRYQLHAQQSTERRPSGSEKSDDASNAGGDARFNLARVMTGAEPMKRKPVQASREGTESHSKGSFDSHPPDPQSQPNAQRTSASATANTGGISETNRATQFAKPDWPASARPAGAHTATVISSLARPVYPPASPTLSGGPSPTGAYPSLRRTSTPGVEAGSAAGTLAAPPGIPKPRSPSPGLLQRMPSFESRDPDPISSRATGTPIRAATTGSGPYRQPNKLNLKSSSVEGLRKLYEERVGVAQGLVEAGRAKKGGNDTRF